MRCCSALTVAATLWGARATGVPGDRLCRERSLHTVSALAVLGPEQDLFSEPERFDPIFAVGTASWLLAPFMVTSPPNTINDPYARTHKWVSGSKYGVLVAVKFTHGEPRRLWTLRFTTLPHHHAPVFGSVLTLFAQDGYVPLYDDGYKRARRDAMMYRPFIHYVVDPINTFVRVILRNRSGNIVVSRVVRNAPNGCLPTLPEEKRLVR